jgi:hypothetical protein
LNRTIGLRDPFAKDVRKRYASGRAIRFSVANPRYARGQEAHMKKLAALSIAFLLLPAIAADAAAARKHGRHTAPKASASEPAPAPTPPVTRLPIAPDTFRA